MSQFTVTFSEIMHRYLYPSSVYESIYDIDFGSLWDDGMRYVFFDVDNTLISYADSDVSIQCMNLFNSIQSVGFEHVMLISNNSNVDRIQRVASQLKLPAVTFACKPFVFTMRRLGHDHGIQFNQSVFIGDQLLTDVLLANSLGMRSIFVDPIDQSTISFVKQSQYKFQSWLMASFFNV